MIDFKREERFIVIKRKHLHDYTESDLRSWLRSNDIKTVECVVVESDRPEYEAVWAMIEGRTATTEYARLEQECKDAKCQAELMQRAAEAIREERDAALKQVEGLRDLLTRCQEQLDPHRDADLWSDVCAALGPKP